MIKAQQSFSLGDTVITGRLLFSRDILVCSSELPHALGTLSWSLVSARILCLISHDLYNLWQFRTSLLGKWLLVSVGYRACFWTLKEWRLSRRSGGPVFYHSF